MSWWICDNLHICRRSHRVDKTVFEGDGRLSYIHDFSLDRLKWCMFQMIVIAVLRETTVSIAAILGSKPTSARPIRNAVGIVQWAMDCLGAFTKVALIFQSSLIGRITCSIRLRLHHLNGIKRVWASDSQISTHSLVIPGKALKNELSFNNAHIFQWHFFKSFLIEAFQSGGCGRFLQSWNFLEIFYQFQG